MFFVFTFIYFIRIKLESKPQKRRNQINFCFVCHIKHWELCPLDLKLGIKHSIFKFKLNVCFTSGVLRKQLNVFRSDLQCDD